MKKKKPVKQAKKIVPAKQPAPKKTVAAPVQKKPVKRVVIPIQRSKFSIITRPKPKPVKAGEKQPTRKTVAPQPVIKQKPAVVRKKNTVGNFYYLDKKDNRVTSKAKWEKYRGWLNKQKALASKPASVVKKHSPDGKVYYYNQDTHKKASKKAWNEYREWVHKQKPAEKAKPKKVKPKKKPSKKKLVSKKVIDFDQVKTKPSAFKTARKFRQKGQIISPRIHITATMICEVLRQNKIQCSYQYIIDKIFDFVDYFMEHPFVIPDIKKKYRWSQAQTELYESWSEKDQYIYSALGFDAEIVERQKCIENLHKYYEKGNAKRFFVRPVVVNHAYADLMVRFNKYLTMYNNYTHIYLGDTIKDIHYLADYYYQKNQLPTGREIKPMQEVIAQYLDFYDDYFTLNYWNKTITFPVVKTYSGGLDFEDYIKTYYGGDIVKLKYYDYMSVLDYHLTIMWKAKDVYLKSASDNTFDFNVLTLTESLTRTYFTDFGQIGVDGADENLGISFIIAEFILESQASGIYLSDVLIKKTGLDIPDEEADEEEEN